MYFEHNSNNTNPEYDPWEQNIYRTGSTKPPKNNNGLVAVLLVAIIILCGVISILSVMNIRLFHQINAAKNEDSLPLMFSHENTEYFPESSISMEATVEPTEIRETVSCIESPASVENIPQNTGLSLQEIYERNIISVVSISCTYPGGSSSGTGVILSEDGYIVTNCHVVENAETVTLLLHDGRTLHASIIGTDVITDLAVLHVSANDLVPAQLGDSSSLRVGDTVVAIGDPLGVELRGTMTDGIISAINRDVNVDGRTMNLIQTNAALNSGNSGGPLINCYGQVIGINTMKMGNSMYSSGVEGLGFAIPSTTVRDIVNQLIEKGYVSGRPDLGIIGEGISEFYQFYYRLPKGLYITEVSPESSADIAGLETGDILISIDGTRITSNSDLETILFGYLPGDTIQAVVYRSGKQYDIILTVGEANS